MEAEMFSESSIVVPWDFSAHSKSALNFALERTSHENIHVICVLEPPNPYELGLLWGDEAKGKARAKCEEEFYGVVSKSKFPKLHFVTEFGDAATEIVRFAGKMEAELIVISTHGRSGIKRLMLGSVAQKVAQTSDRPIILLPNSWFSHHQTAEFESIVPVADSQEQDS